MYDSITVEAFECAPRLLLQTPSFLLFSFSLLASRRYVGSLRANSNFWKPPLSNLPARLVNFRVTTNIKEKNDLAIRIGERLSHDEE